VKVIKVDTHAHRKVGMATAPIDPPVKVSAGEKVLFVLRGKP
jgi:hypothetical protein